MDDLASNFRLRLGLLDFQKRDYSSVVAGTESQPLPYKEAVTKLARETSGVLYFRGGLQPAAKPKYVVCPMSCCSKGEVRVVHVQPTLAHESEDSPTVSTEERGRSLALAPGSPLTLSPSQHGIRERSRSTGPICRASLRLRSHSAGSNREVQHLTSLAKPSTLVPCLNWNKGRCSPTDVGAACPHVPEGRRAKHHVCSHCHGGHQSGCCPEADVTARKCPPCMSPLMAKQENTVAGKHASMLANLFKIHPKSKGSKRR